MGFRTFEITTLDATYTGVSIPFTMCYGWNWSIETEATNVNGTPTYTVLVRNSDSSGWAELNIESTNVPFSDKIDGNGRQFVFRQIMIQQNGSGTTGSIKYTFTASN
jgi:hypothetical protein